MLTDNNAHDIMDYKELVEIALDEMKRVRQFIAENTTYKEWRYLNEHERD
jgi:hypothetical protein